MTIERGDKVIATRDIGGAFSSEHVPKGTAGVVTEVDGGLFGTGYTVAFTIERAIFEDSHVTMSRLSTDDIARA